jgi:hypothetical protein
MFLFVNELQKIKPLNKIFLYKTNFKLKLNIYANTKCLYDNLA